MQEQSLGAEAERFCPKQDLYLTPLSRIEINIKLPKVCRIFCSSVLTVFPHSHFPSVFSFSLTCERVNLD